MDGNERQQGNRNLGNVPQLIKQRLRECPAEIKSVSAALGATTNQDQATE
jgi:hypothetical protein